MAETPKEQKESAQIDSREMEGMRFDDILGLIGEMGVYQIVLLLLIFLAIIPMALQSMIYVFESDKVDHWCNVIEWSDAVKKCLDLRDNPENYLQCLHRYRDSSIPSTNEDGLVEYSKCLKYDIEYPSKLSDDFIIDNFTYSKIQCDEGWVYDQHQYISTTVTEFDLVCEKSHLSGTTQSIFYFGYLVGAWSSGSLADLRHLTEINFISVHRIIPESPRWLMDRNDYEEAEKILRKVATFNKTLDKLPSNLTEILHEGQKNSEINLKKENTIVHIFKKPRMRMATFILFALWSSGMGVCAAIARIGSISSPIILIIGDVWKPFPYIVCGPMALVVASAVLILPDTRRIALPGTLKDAEDFLKRNRKSRKGKDGIAGNQSAQAGGMTNEAFIDCKEV
ncbi:Solute carrier family 22 member 21 [Holothuria leucospilota]|uniref:Solute carrier family 22 member 21 n=1 Tax=Holothuria leucospilota TaxID=206669 RepID=A0A9Q1BJM3_HOLLE|nr:Solute carrier family 22 member 21 [Holothuria leucospilota]